jgi:anti-sigma regulatory factor (Ser/Thr protein kinase)
MQRFYNSFWLHICYSKQGLSRTFRTAPSLLPILQRINTDTDHMSKLRLRLVELLTNFLNYKGAKLKNSARLDIPTVYRPGLINTC